MRQKGSVGTTDESASITFLIPEPLDKALRLVRRGFGQAQLSVWAEMDISGKLRQELGVGLMPCRILCVVCPVLLLEAAVLHPSVGVFLPVHVVASERRGQTQLYVVSPAFAQNSSLPLGLQLSVAKLLNRITQALETIAGRHSPAAATA